MHFNGLGRLSGRGGASLLVGLTPVAAGADRLARGRAHADRVALVELDRVGRLVLAKGAERQRVWAREHGPAALASMLAARYAASNGRTGPAPRFVSPREGAFVDPLRSGHSPSIERSDRCVAGLPTRVHRSC